MMGCHAEIVTSQWQVAPMSKENVATMVARRSCSPRGVPLPIRRRITSPEIEAARMNQQALEDIGVAAQMRRASHRCRRDVRRSVDLLASLTHQTLAARATKPPPIGIHQGLGCGLL